MIPTGVSMLVSGGAVSPENRSNEEREIAEQYLYDGDRDHPLNLGYYALLDVADSVAALESAHVAALARIAAVEAERDALAVIIANEAQTLRAYHVGPLAADNPVDAAHLADHLDAELLAALAASPAPTGPEPCSTCDGSGQIYLEGHPGAPGTGGTHTCPDCGPRPVERLDDDLSVIGGAATPEPTEETP